MARATWVFFFCFNLSPQIKSGRFPSLNITAWRFPKQTSDDLHNRINPGNKIGSTNRHLKKDINKDTVTWMTFSALSLLSPWMERCKWCWWSGSGRHTHRWGTGSLRASNAYWALQCIWNPQEYPWGKENDFNHYLLLYRFTQINQ